MNLKQFKKYIRKQDKKAKQLQESIEFDKRQANAKEMINIGMGAIIEVNPALGGLIGMFIDEDVIDAIAFGEACSKSILTK